jgi:hypothetical protein
VKRHCLEVRLRLNNLSVNFYFPPTKNPKRIQLTTGAKCCLLEFTAVAKFARRIFVGFSKMKRLIREGLAAERLENPDDGILINLKGKFKVLYDKLIPMTNAEVPAHMMLMRPMPCV